MDFKIYNLTPYEDGWLFDLLICEYGIKIRSCFISLLTQKFILPHVDISITSEDKLKSQIEKRIKNFLNSIPTEI